MEMADVGAANVFAKWLESKNKRGGGGEGGEGERERGREGIGDRGR